MPRKCFDFSRFASYDENTKKSTCLIETCRKELSGKLKSNIKRHYKLVHKRDIESDIEESDDEDIVAQVKRKYRSFLKLDMQPDDNKEPEPKKKKRISNATNVKPANETTILNASSVSPATPEEFESIFPPKDDPLLVQQQERQAITSQSSDPSQQIIQIWAGKLAKMSRVQRIIAEKVINEVMFNGELGLLNVKTGLTNIGTVINTASTIEYKEDIIEIGNTNIFDL